MANPDRPTLSLSFKIRAGEVDLASRSTRHRIPPFFANLLPEGHLRRYLAAKAGVKSEREFFLLAALGEDLSGAITVHPLEEFEVGAPPEEASRAGADPRREQAMRFSLAGIQLKFSAIVETTGGLTIPVHGVGGSWMVKLPSAHFTAGPENEFAMLELARSVGIEVPPIRLVPVSEIKGLPPEIGVLDGDALAVERFDRGPGGQRIHMEDFAQIFGLFPSDNYEKRSYANIAYVLRSEGGDRDLDEFVCRLVFSILIGNGDMHLKNWSVLYPDGRRPVLSPAYDFVATTFYIPGDKLGLTFGGSRSLKEITQAQVRRFSESAHLPLKSIWDLVLETVERTSDAWKTLAPKDLLPLAMQKVIDKQIATVAANTR